MLSSWLQEILSVIITLNDILTAGISITAFSLLIYSFSFNLRDRVARSFALILLCVVVVFTSEAIQSTIAPDQFVELFLRLQWFGIVFLPAAYLHLSDAVLVTAGRPSRGRRRIAVRMMYVLSSIFLVLLSSGYLLGDFVPNGSPAPHLKRTLWTEVFTIYYLIAMIWAAINFARAYRRMITRAGRRRMLYLMAGATAPALGSYPYMLYGSSIAASYPFLFWTAAMLINIAVAGLIILMAYAVAFFGVSWPDRVVKSRLFKWIMRGPVTASSALAVMTVVRRGGEFFGMPAYTAAVPVATISTVLLLEHAITLAAPLWERWLFFGKDREQLRVLQNLEERLLTQTDLREFLESALAAVRDHMQSPSAFVAALEGDHLALLVTAGRALQEKENLSDALEVIEEQNNQNEFLWREYWILPLRLRKRPDMDLDNVPALIGLLGVARSSMAIQIEQDQRQALWRLADRAALALEDRHLQQNIFRSLEDLQPDVELIQNLRAASRYDTAANMLAEEIISEPDPEMSGWVKDALTHYWGGPKLTQSPLMQFQVVKNIIDEQDGNIANAMRALLRNAIDNIRPEGERRFTSEWILFNILEMKFVEGRKVREVANKLAMSEADLYRKQRIAIEAVAHAILEMESHVINNDVEKSKK